MDNGNNLNSKAKLKFSGNQMKFNLKLNPFAKMHLKSLFFNTSLGMEKARKIALSVEWSGK